MIYVAILYDKTNPKYHNLKGNIRLSLGQHQKALEDLKKACQYVKGNNNKFCKDYLTTLFEVDYPDMLKMLSSLLGISKNEAKDIIVEILLKHEILDDLDDDELNEKIKYLITKFLP
jgi:hypothetical protein